MFLNTPAFQPSHQNHIHTLCPDCLFCFARKYVTWPNKILINITYNSHDLHFLNKSKIFHFWLVMIFGSPHYSGVVFGMDAGDYRHSSVTTKRPESSPWGLMGNIHSPLHTATVYIKLQNLQLPKVCSCATSDTELRPNKYLLLDLGSAQDMKCRSLKRWLQRLEGWRQGRGWGHGDNDDENSDDGMIIEMIMMTQGWWPSYTSV